MRRIGLLLVILALMLVGTVSAHDHHPTTYTVQRGDTITGIANAYGVDVDALLVVNNLIDPNSIRAGQVLVIPTQPVTVPRSHVVQPGETLTDIAIRYSTTVNDLIAVNTIVQPNNLTVGQVLTLPHAAGPANFARTYIVEIGDTLRIIGAQFGVSWQQLAAFNNIPNPNYIQAGMMLHIPPADYVPHPAPQPVYHPSPPPAQPANITYVVQAGDVLSIIAQHFGVTVASIRAANHLHPSDPIFPGQVLVIPPHGHPPAYHPPQPPVHGVYHVRYGDTLFAIAARFHVNIYDLAERNGLLNLNHIFVGQSLVIPGY